MLAALDTFTELKVMQDILFSAAPDFDINFPQSVNFEFRNFVEEQDEIARVPILNLSVGHNRRWLVPPSRLPVNLPVGPNWEKGNGQERPRKK